ncbi:MAG: hypothetical protein ACTHL8_01620 [Burkholderiaceae bacterium]
MPNSNRVTHGATTAGQYMQMGKTGANTAVQGAVGNAVGGAAVTGINDSTGDAVSNYLSQQNTALANQAAMASAAANMQNQTAAIDMAQQDNAAANHQAVAMDNARNKLANTGADGMKDLA